MYYLFSCAAVLTVNKDDYKKEATLRLLHWAIAISSSSGGGRPVRNVIGCVEQINPTRMIVVCPMCIHMRASDTTLG